MISTRRRSVVVESIGVFAGLALIAAALLHLLLNDRSWLVYYDGDSMQLPILLASLREGAPQNWILSSVLFIPEAGLYLAIGVLGLGVKSTITLYAVVVLLLVYLGFRATAWAATSTSRERQVIGALAALATVVLWIVTESDSDRYSLQVVSLIASTGYYASSIIAMLLGLALIARLTRSPSFSVGWWVALAATVALIVGSVLNNPLFIVWFCAPVGLVLLVVTATRLVRLRFSTVVAVGVVAGAALGLYARGPFAGLIGQSGLGYVHPELSGVATDTLRIAVETRLSSAAGVLCTILLAIAVAVSLLAIVSGFRRRDAARVAVGLFPLVSGIALVVGSLALGLSSWRYFMPVFFSLAVPFLFLVADLRTAGHAARGVGRRAIAIGAGMAVLVAFVGVAEASASRTERIAAAEDSIGCVSQWIDDHDTPVLGEFWTSRAAKAYSDSPSRVVQVLDTFMRWRWLVNLEDFVGVDSAEYLIAEAGEPPIVQRASLTSTRVSEVDCGTYTISRWEPALAPTDITG